MQKNNNLLLAAEALTQIGLTAVLATHTRNEDMMRQSWEMAAASATVAELAVDNGTDWPSAVWIGLYVIATVATRSTESLAIMTASIIEELDARTPDAAPEDAHRIVAECLERDLGISRRRMEAIGFGW